MRNFEILDTVRIDEAEGVIRLSNEQGGANPIVALRREGGYVAIAASYGPIEIALRPRFQELARVLSRLQPVTGLQTSRQVGTGQSYIALGLDTEGQLIMRPTIVTDATGHLAFNIILSNNARQALFEWLPVEAAS